jgi:hypothetical protein
MPMISMVRMVRNLLVPMERIESAMISPKVIMVSGETGLLGGRPAPVTPGRHLVRQAEDRGLSLTRLAKLRWILVG